MQEEIRATGRVNKRTIPKVYENEGKETSRRRWEIVDCQHGRGTEWQTRSISGTAVLGAGLRR